MSLNKYIPSWVKRIGVVTVLLLFVAGIVFWGGFNWALEATNKESFCISCHEMQENVFKEYQNTIHYTNRTGVRATCPDCHVPKEWGPKMIRKVQGAQSFFWVRSWLAACSKDTSSKRADITWRPKGIPLLCLKRGREMAGQPTRLAITV